MKYYLHDTSAFDDEKVTELFINFGYEGVGLFYVVLEKLAKQEKPVKTEVLKKQLRIGKKLEKCWKFMEEIGIISSNNGETFNKQLLNFSEKYQIKKEKTRKKVSEWREKQEIAETVTSYKDECNPPKVKKSKVNEIDNKLKKFIKPELIEISDYCLDRKNSVDANKFFNYYESNGWQVGKNKMKDWRAAVRTWEANDVNPKQNGTERVETALEKNFRIHAEVQEMIERNHPNE